MGDELGLPEGTEVGEPTGLALGDPEGTAEGLAVGALVGVAEVGVNVGMNVGIPVGGKLVGWLVLGLIDGSADCLAVGCSVGARVGSIPTIGMGTVGPCVATVGLPVVTGLAVTVVGLLVTNGMGSVVKVSTVGVSVVVLLVGEKVVMGEGKPGAPLKFDGWLVSRLDVGVNVESTFVGDDDMRSAVGARVGDRLEGS